MTLPTLDQVICSTIGHSWIMEVSEDNNINNNNKNNDNNKFYDILITHTVS